MTAFIRKYGRFFIIAWLVYTIARSVYFTFDYLYKTHFSALQPIDFIFENFCYYAFDIFFIVLLFLKRYRLLFFLASYYAVLVLEYFLSANSYNTFEWIPAVHHIFRMVAIVVSLMLIPLSHAGIFNLSHNTPNFGRTLKAMTLFNAVTLSLWSAFLIVVFFFYPVISPIALLSILCVLAFIVHFFVARNFLTIVLFGLLVIFLMREVIDLFDFGAVYFINQVGGLDSIAVPITFALSILITTLIWLFIRALNIHRAERLELVNDTQALDDFGMDNR